MALFHNRFVQLHPGKEEGSFFQSLQINSIARDSVKFSLLNAEGSVGTRYHLKIFPLICISIARQIEPYR